MMEIYYLSRRTLNLILRVFLCGVCISLSTFSYSQPSRRFVKPQSGINHIIIYGQSLSTGQQTPPALSTTNYAGNLMLGDQVWSNFSNNINAENLIFNPLVARPTIAFGKSNQDIIADTSIDANHQVNCEPPVIGFANAVKSLCDEYSSGFADKKFAATSCGEGGRSIELLMKDCPNREGVYYNHFLKMIERSSEAAKRMDQKINCTAILWMQGEYNYGGVKNQGWQPNTFSTQDKNVYKNYLSTLVGDMISDIKSTYNQPKAPIVITYQCGAQYTKDFNVPIGMAQLELANKDPRIIMAGPIYPVSDRGGHLCPNGSRWYGEMMAKVYFKTVIKNERWTPLQPKFITHGKDYIDVTFSVPQKPLRIDTLTLEKAVNFGFEIKENGSAKIISSIKLLKADVVRLVVNEPFNKGDIEINYAGPSTKGNGNLCDSDTFTSFETYKDLTAIGETTKQKNRFKPKYEPKDADGKVIYNQKYPLQNFSCAFYYLISSGEQKIKCF